MRELHPEPNYKFVVLDAIALGNVSDTLLKSIKIEVHSENITPDFRASLVKLLKSNKGNTPLSIILCDAKTGWKVELGSKKYRVRVNSDFIWSLREMGLEHHIEKAEL